MFACPLVYSILSSGFLSIKSTSHLENEHPGAYRNLIIVSRPARWSSIRRTVFKWSVNRYNVFCDDGVANTVVAIIPISSPCRIELALSLILSTIVFGPVTVLVIILSSKGPALAGCIDPSDAHNSCEFEITVLYGSGHKLHSELLRIELFGGLQAVEGKAGGNA